jgi:hypothetical protein
LKVLILVSNSTFYPSNLIVPFIKKTWGKDKRVDTIYYEGGGEEVTFKNNVLKLDVASTSEKVNEKGIKAFRWVLENRDFDFVFRCTTTTYLNIDGLLRFLDDKKPKNFFCGPVDYYPPLNIPQDQKIMFVSGAGCFFSKDVLETFMQNIEKYDESLNDDVGISKLLISDLGIKVTEGYRQDFYDGYPFMNNIDFSNYHFRFKLSPNYYPRYLEIITLLSIHIRRKLIDRAIYAPIIWIVDTFLFLLFRLFRLFNLNFVKYKSKSIFNKLKKLVVQLAKKIPILVKVNKSLKNR